MTNEEFVTRVTEEIIAVGKGVSKHVHGAVQFNPEKLPLLKVLSAFQTAPSKETFKLVLEQADQEFGYRFGVFVRELSTGMFPDVPVVPAPVVEIPWKQDLHNQLTTILARGRERAIDQKLLDTLQDDVGRLANCIDKRIDERAKSMAATALKVAFDEIEKLKEKIAQGGLETRYNRQR